MPDMVDEPTIEPELVEAPDEALAVEPETTAEVTPLPMPIPMVEVPADVVVGILQYLSSRPWGEVSHLMDALKPYYDAT